MAARALLFIEAPLQPFFSCSPSARDFDLVYLKRGQFLQAFPRFLYFLQHFDFLLSLITSPSTIVVCPCFHQCF